MLFTNPCVWSGKDATNYDKIVTLVATLFRRNPFESLDIKADFSFVLRSTKRRRVEEAQFPALNEASFTEAEIITYDGLKPQRGLTNQHNIVEVLVGPKLFLPAQNMKLAFVLNGIPSVSSHLFNLRISIRPLLLISKYIQSVEVDASSAMSAYAHTPCIEVKTTASTYVSNGGKKYECHDADKALYHFINMEASSEPTPSTDDRGSPTNEVMEISQQNGNPLFQVYSPYTEGPLTMDLLERIVRRKHYSEEGCTKLMVAAYVGHWSLVDQLVKEGADIHRPDRHGRSALWWAAHGWGGPKFASMMTGDGNGTESPPNAFHLMRHTSKRSFAERKRRWHQEFAV